MQINEIKNLLGSYGIKPSKAKGQNFLIDKNVLAEIVKSAALSKNDAVLEIGPGFGILTEELVKNSAKILTVELDSGLVNFLQKKFSSQPNLEILAGDILALKNADLLAKLKSQKYKVVANLPYAITKPIFRKFLTYEPKPEIMVVLVQKEVAQKMAAKAGEMSLLSLSVQFYGQPEIIDYVASSSFYPQPKVDSAILKVKIYGQNLPPEFAQFPALKNKFVDKNFWRLVKFGFSSPRKQLQNNLAAGLKISKQEVKEGLKSANLREDLTAEALSLTDWLSLYQQFMV